MALPPWQVVGQPATVLKTAYGGFWGLAGDAGRGTSQHTCADGVGRGVDGHVEDAAMLGASHSAKRSMLDPLLPTNCASTCKGSLTLLQARLAILEFAPICMGSRQWVIVKVFVTEKGACEQGAALCTQDTLDQLTIAGFVTSAVMQRESTEQVAGMAVVANGVWGSAKPAWMVNPYASCVRRQVRLQVCHHL